MNRQKTFDRVTRHLLAQGVKSATATDLVVGGKQIQSLYRGPYGTRCALGCLISDDRYHEGLEGLMITSPDVQKAIGVSKPYDVSFLWHLQFIHDRHVPEDWPEALRIAAWKFDLNASVVEETR